MGRERGNWQYIDSEGCTYSQNDVMIQYTTHNHRAESRQWKRSSSRLGSARLAGFLAFVYTPSINILKI